MVTFRLLEDNLGFFDLCLGLQNLRGLLLALLIDVRVVGGLHTLLVTGEIIAIETDDLFDKHVQHTRRLFRVTLVERRLLHESSDELGTSWNLALGSK